ncbi:MAG: type II toxin-antitoxin system RelE/ParE family toxin [Actinobacteria bacterium]|nr:type II toxin-antitoxin system RelE/ParE family toxin [Actinomycetota bacterium]
MAELRLTRRAREDLEGLPVEIQEAVLDVLTEIEADPEALGKALVGALRGLWSARVGNYRVLYTVEDARGNQHVIVRAVRHRAVAYRRRRR